MLIYSIGTGTVLLQSIEKFTPAQSQNPSVGSLENQNQVENQLEWDIHSCDSEQIFTISSREFPLVSRVIFHSKIFREYLRASLRHARKLTTSTAD